MPSYKFRDCVTGDVFEHSMRISEYDSYMLSNPGFERYFEPSDGLNIVSGVGGIRNDGGWKDTLAKISEAHPSSPLADRHGASKSIKQAQTENVINKHFGK